LWFVASSLRTAIPYQIISFLALAQQYDQTELATADKLAERSSNPNIGNNSMSNILKNQRNSRSGKI